MSEPFAPDPALPGLCAALDVEGVGARVGAALRAWSRDRLQLGGVSLERVRYRPGKRAILLYSAWVQDDADDSTQRSWFSGSLFRGDKSARLAAEYAAAAAPGQRLPTALLDATAGMLVQFFPHDRHLPQLAGLLGADQATLAALVGDRNPAGLRRLAPVRYRPGISATLRCAGGERTAYVKVARDRDARAHHHDLAALHAALGDGPVTVPRPLGWSEPLGAVAVAEARGDCLLDTVAAGGCAAATGAARRTARALRALHAAPVRVRRVARPEAVLDSVEQSVRLLRLACADQREVIDGLLGDVAARLQPAVPAPVHMDLKPEHVFIEPERVCFIDADDLAMGDPMLDVGMLIARLEALPLAGTAPAEVAAAAASAFREEYLSGFPASAARRLPVARAWAACRIAQHWLQHQVPDWRLRIAHTLEGASLALLETANHHA